MSESREIYLFQYFLIVVIFPTMIIFFWIFFSMLNIYTVTENEQSPGIYKYWYTWEKKAITDKKGKKEQ